MDVATLLGIVTPELCRGASEFVASCQTHEGGIAGVPNAEAHGGYAYCAVAAMHFLDHLSMFDLDALQVRFNLPLSQFILKMRLGISCCFVNDYLKDMVTTATSTT
jgi:prenyltransferase beta subunit